MKIEIPAPRNYEIKHGSCAAVHTFLNEVEQAVGEVCNQSVISRLHISLLLAHPDEIAKGKFREYMRFDWKLGYGAVGVQGDYNRYHAGNDSEKISVISQMLHTAFLRVAGRRKTKFNAKLASDIVDKIAERYIVK